MANATATTAPAKKTAAKKGGARPNSGRKAGFVSEKRKFASKTKVARVPEGWNVSEINEGLEYLASIMDDAKREIAEAQARSAKGTASNRFEKLAGFIQEMEGMFPQTFTADQG